MTVIQIDNLHYAYPPLAPDQELHWVLRGIDLCVAQGEFLAIMGPTGVGKTTLCMSLNGLVPQATGGVIRGQVQVLGREARQTPVAELAAEVGIVYQDPESQLFSTTVLDEVAFGPENLGLDAAEITERIDWALNMVNMSLLADRSPTELSGGQKQRVAIAASLAMLPKLLILDEPTASLDPLGRRQVFEVVSRLCRERQMTIVLVSHDAEHVAEFADRVAVLWQGQIVRCDTPRNILSDQPLMQQCGLAAPQVTELGHGLGRLTCPTPLLTLDEAERTLRAKLSICLEQPQGLALHNPSVRQPHPPSEPAIIKVESLSHHYNPETELPIPALNEISLEIAKGAFVGLIGPNGSGKTTLVKHFNGLLRPTHGHVIVNGLDTRRVGVSHLARQVGHVFQNPDHQIFCATTEEELRFGPRNLGLAPDEVNQRVAQALELFDLGAYADTPPALLGYGLRRLVSIAAVYTMRPEVLILDEPTGGLDWRSATALMALVQALHQDGHTIILVSHDMRLIAEYAEETLVLEGGRVLAYGPTRNVLGHLDTLAQPQLEPPPVTRLGAALADVGLPRDLLTVDEFIRAFRLRCLGKGGQ